MEDLGERWRKGGGGQFGGCSEPVDEELEPCFIFLASIAFSERVPTNGGLPQFDHVKHLADNIDILTINFQQFNNFDPSYHTL